MLLPWKLAKLQVQITSLLFTHFHFDLMTFFRCQEETKNKSIMFLETATPCALQHLLPECSLLCSVSQGKRLETWRFVSCSLIFCDNIAQPNWRGQLSRLLPHLFLTSVQVVIQQCTVEHKAGKCFADALKLLKTDIIRSQGELLLKVGISVQSGEGCMWEPRQWILKGRTSLFIYVCDGPKYKCCFSYIFGIWVLSWVWEISNLFFFSIFIWVPGKSALSCDLAWILGGGT